MATTRQYFIPGWGYINEDAGASSSTKQFLIAAWGFLNQTVTASASSQSPVKHAHGAFG